jgi:hypothetical protein
VAPISADIAAAGLTLNGGGVLVGPEYLSENANYPRIIVDPIGHLYRQRDPSDGFGSNPAAYQVQAIGSRDLLCDVHIWGADYDGVMAIENQWWLSCFKILGNAPEMRMPGKYINQTTLDRLGRWYKCGWKIPTPLVNTPYPFVPSGTKGAGTTEIKLPDGSIETGCGP